MAATLGAGHLDEVCRVWPDCSKVSLPLGRRKNSLMRAICILRRLVQQPRTQAHSKPKFAEAEPSQAFRVKAGTIRSFFSLILVLHILVALVLAAPSVKATPLALVPDVIALNGQVAPGTDGAVFSRFFDPVQSDSGSVVFRAVLEGPDVNSSNHVGVWQWTSGTLQLIARLGDAAPGQDGVLSSLGDPTINSSDEIAFNGGIWTGPNEVLSVIWMRNAAGLSPIVMEGDVAPGTGTTFLDFCCPNARPAISNSGDVSFFANLVTTDGSQNPSVWTISDATLRLVANDGDAAPGTIGETFRGFLAPTISASGAIAFSGDTASNSRGIWTDSVGTLTSVALPGEVAPGTSGETFLSALEGVVINDLGRTAFEGESGGQLWRAGSDGFDLVLSRGDPVSGLAGATWHQFKPLKFGDVGDLIFQGRFFIDNDAVDGLFSLTISDLLDDLVLDGDFLQVDSADFRQINDIRANQSYSQNLIDDFAIPFRASFFDNSSGLFIVSSETITVPVVLPPSPVPVPSAFALFVTGLIGMGLVGWRQRTSMQEKAA